MVDCIDARVISVFKNNFNNWMRNIVNKYKSSFTLTHFKFFYSNLELIQAFCILFNDCYNIITLNKGNLFRYSKFARKKKRSYSPAAFYVFARHFSRPLLDKLIISHWYFSYKSLSENATRMVFNPANV